MHVTRLGLGPLETNCWIVSATVDGPVVVIDPGADEPALFAALGDRDVAAVVLTHAHFDHIGGADALVSRSGALLVVHEDDAKRLAHDGAEGTGGAAFGFADVVSLPPDRLVSDGDIIEGGGVRFTVLHTPGHTPGGIALLAQDPDGGASHLFSGDTLFAGSVGRSDFPGGDSRALSRAIATKLAPLPPDTVVHPGHGPDTTIGREARGNPFWPRA